MVGTVVDGCGDSKELRRREDLRNDTLRTFGFGVDQGRCYAVVRKISGDVFGINKQTGRCDIAKEALKNLQDVDAKCGLLLKLGDELGTESWNVRKGRKDGDDVGGMGLGFLAVVARFFRSPQIVVSVREGQEFQHNESTGSGDANLPGKGAAVGKIARNGVPLGLR